MDLRPLGTTGLRVSSVALGCWVGTDMGVFSLSVPREGCAKNANVHLWFYYQLLKSPFAAGCVYDPSVFHHRVWNNLLA